MSNTISNGILYPPTENKIFQLVHSGVLDREQLNQFCNWIENLIRTGITEEKRDENVCRFKTIMPPEVAAQLRPDYYGEIIELLDLSEEQLRKPFSDFINDYSAKNPQTPVQNIRGLRGNLKRNYGQGLTLYDLLTLPPESLLGNVQFGLKKLSLILDILRSELNLVSKYTYVGDKYSPEFKQWQHLPLFKGLQLPSAII